MFARPVPDREITAQRLLKTSAKHSYDPAVEIDWEAPLAPDRYFLDPRRSSLYGTALWEQMSEQQRIALTKHELASLYNMGIWFETILMQMLIRQVYDRPKGSAHARYGWTEIADECRHSVMFARTAEKFGAPSYQPPPSILRLGRIFAAKGDGPSAYAAILVAEEILDIFQRDLMKDERVQPLTRMVSRIHVLEEARHMTFAREEVERTMPTLSRPQLAWHRMMTAQTAFMVARTLVNPQVYVAVGLDPREAKRAAFSNPHYQETLGWMGERVVGFLDEQDLIGPTQRRIWTRSLLLPG
jgi:hypothetical protein